MRSVDFDLWGICYFSVLQVFAVEGKEEDGVASVECFNWDLRDSWISELELVPF